MRKDDDPGQPAARCIQHRLDGTLHAVVELDAGLDMLADMSPGHRYDEADDNGNDVHNESECPGDRDVGGSPEEPSFDVILDIAAMVVGVGLVPEEVDEECGGDNKAGEDGGTDEGREEKGDDPAYQAKSL